MRGDQPALLAFSNLRFGRRCVQEPRLEREYRAAAKGNDSGEDRRRAYARRDRNGQRNAGIAVVDDGRRFLAVDVRLVGARADVRSRVRDGLKGLLGAGDLASEPDQGVDRSQKHQQRLPQAAFLTAPSIGPPTHLFPNSKIQREAPSHNRPVGQLSRRG